jgi:K+-sensing histidine kinase KdpD
MLYIKKGAFMDDKELKMFSHDLKNALTVVDVMSSIALKNLDEGEIKKAHSKLTKMKSRLDSTVKLLSSVLDGVSGSRLPVNNLINMLFNDICEDYDIKSKLVVTFPCMVEADSTKIRRIIENIIKNAKEGGASKMACTLSKSTLTFTDNGSGFTKEVISAFKAHKPLTTKKLGYGLGLISMKEVAASFGWEMRIGTNGNQGAQITFILTNSGS